MAKQFTPAGHRLLIKREEYKKTTDWGFEISSDEKMEKAALNRGTVLAIGPTCWRTAWLGDGQIPWCKVGDVILFAKYAGTTFIDEDTKEEYLLIQDEDVIMILEDKENE